MATLCTREILSFRGSKAPGCFRDGPIVPEEALFAPAASLGGPMYPTANIQAVHGPQRLGDSLYF